MKKDNKKNTKQRDFHVQRIIRNEEENVVNTTYTNTNIRNLNNLAENVGYHLDPSRYDALRGGPAPKKEGRIIGEGNKYQKNNNVKTKEKKVEIIREEAPVIEDATPLSEDALEALANEYNANNDGETKLVDVISMAELEQELAKQNEDNVDNKIQDENQEDESGEEDDYILPVVDLSVSPLTANLETKENKKEQYNNDSSFDVTSLDDEEEMSDDTEEETIQEEGEEEKDIVHVIKRSVEQPNKKTNEEFHTKGHKYQKYIAPSLDLLKKSSGNSEADIKFAEEQKAKIDQIIVEYKIKAHVERYVFGPTVIVFLIKYDSLTEDVTSIRKAEKNLQMYLSNANIRLLTPIPNMPYAGIEVPRPAGQRDMVLLGDMLSDNQFINSKMNLPVAVGKDSFGKNVYIDLTDMPHGLAAGASKSGKSVTLNAFIMSLIYHLTPNDVRLILMDPKVIEFNKYRDLPHLACPVITEAEYLEPVLEWLVLEMERRYKILDKYSCLDFDELNETLVELKEDKIPYLVVIFDEFNDWFSNASNQTELYTSRLMAKARAAGINIILATQHPSADVIKGVIKANLTTRFAFRVTSYVNSSVILGQGGAEKLEGRGDMILRYTGMDDTRLQAAYVSNSEVKNVMEFLRSNNEPDYIVTLEELKQSATSRGAGNGSSDPHVGRNDELFEEVARYVVANQNASVNQLQKIFGTGFNRMDAIFKDMEVMGIISPAQQGTKRKVLVNEVELDDVLKIIQTN